MKTTRLNAVIHCVKKIFKKVGESLQDQMKASKNNKANLNSLYMREWLSGGAPPCQGGGRGFDPRLALLFFRSLKI